MLINVSSNNNVTGDLDVTGDITSTTAPGGLITARAFETIAFGSGGLGMTIYGLTTAENVTINGSSNYLTLVNFGIQFLDTVNGGNGAFATYDSSEGFVSLNTGIEITVLDSTSGTAADVLVAIGGKGDSGGKGSDISLTCGDGGDITASGTGGEGGDIALTAGNGGDAENISGPGGDIDLIAGNAGAGIGVNGAFGGYISLTSGNGRAGTVSGFAGGDINITAGDGDFSSPISSPGGNIIITSGSSPGVTGSGTGGDITLDTGTGGGANADGDILFKVGGVDVLTISGVFTGRTTFANDSIIIENSQSPGSGDAGIAGEIAWDASYIYICTASGAWKRAALTGGY